MLSLPLFAATLALAPTGNTTRLELATGGGVQSVVVAQQPPGSGSSIGGQGGLGLTLYGHRIVDDDAPPSLQPYLQYAFQLHVDGGAGGFRYTPDPPASAPGNDSVNGYANVTASGYFDRAVYGSLALGMRYRSDSAGSFTTLLLPMTASAGFRFGDVRLALGWSVTPTRVDAGVFKVPFWGGALAQVYAVVRRRLGLVAEVDVVDGGALAHGGVTGYFLRRFSLGASVDGGHGRQSAYAFSYDTAGGGVTFRSWIVSRVAVAVDYSFTWTRYAYANGSGEDDYTNLVGLTLVARPF